MNIPLPIWQPLPLEREAALEEVWNKTSLTMPIVPSEAIKELCLNMSTYISVSCDHATVSYRYVVVVRTATGY